MLTALLVMPSAALDATDGTPRDAQSLAHAHAINKKSKILAYAKPPFAKVTNKLCKKIAKCLKSKEKVTFKVTREAIGAQSDAETDAVSDAERCARGH
jgi:hypothetical protein